MTSNVLVKPNAGDILLLVGGETTKSSMTDASLLFYTLGRHLLLDCCYQLR